MNDFSLETHLGHCKTCITNDFSKSNGLAVCFIFNMLDESKLKKSCPCSQCIVKMICHDDCEALNNFVSLLRHKGEK